MSSDTAPDAAETFSQVDLDGMKRFLAEGRKNYEDTRLPDDWVDALLSMASRTLDAEQKLAVTEHHFQKLGEKYEGLKAFLDAAFRENERYEKLLAQAQKQAQEAEERAGRAEAEVERLSDDKLLAVPLFPRQHTGRSVDETLTLMQKARLGQDPHWTGKTAAFKFPLPAACACQYVKDGLLCIDPACPVHGLYQTPSQAAADNDAAQ